MSSFRKPQQILRVSGGHYDEEGMWQPGETVEEFSILASVQPMNLNETQQYSQLKPEGATSLKAVKIYSTEPLRAALQERADGTPGVEADILLWRGRRWKVVFCAEWQSDVINHYKMVAWEVEPSADSDAEISA